VAAILVVDDDPTVREVVVAYLEQAGHSITEAKDGPGAIAAANSATELVVLDVMLPGFDGLEVCRQLRVSQPDLPIVMLSALGEEEDRIAGLGLGADDYLSKPFSPRELVLRVASLLRRTQSQPAASAPEVIDGDLRVDSVARTASLSGEPLALTSREFDLLAYLVSHPGAPFSREQLLSEVWGWEFGDLTTVTVHVRRLREKVELAPSEPVRLVTVWGVGYRWDPA
jgi:DNA-binding response OmpR family regulator